MICKMHYGCYYRRKMEKSWFIFYLKRKMGKVWAKYPRTKLPNSDMVGKPGGATLGTWWSVESPVRGFVP
jgi:hypothetical protein